MNNAYFIKHKKYLAQIKEDIDDAEKVLSKSGSINFKSFDLHDSLNTTIWDEDLNLRSDIREQLLKIAHDFYDTLDISEIATGEEKEEQETDETFRKYIKDVLFVGSLASYNYSSYADVDLHLLMDEKALTGKSELALSILKKYFTECKNDWNLHHIDLKVEGFDCELYVQDIEEENAANGVYSIFNDEWVKRPEKMDSQKFDRAWVEKKALDYIEQIDNLEDVINSKSDPELIEHARARLDAIKDKIVQGRRDSLAAGQGEMNKYNILFKILRRSGHIEKINNLKIRAYDMLNSIDTKKEKESVDMKKEQSTIKESVDPIVEFADMYGEEAADALQQYLEKRPNKTVEEILTSDAEFTKFGNWAYKHLDIDVYSNFTKYDVGTFYDRTSTLAKNPMDDVDDDEELPPRIDDRTYSVLDGDDDNYDSPFEESNVAENNISLTQQVRDILAGKNSEFETDDESDYYEFGFTGALVNSADMNKAVYTITKAIEDYRNGICEPKRLEATIENVLTLYGNDIPAYIENDAVMMLLDLADEQSKPLTEDNEQDKLKTKIIIGAEDENTTVVITRQEPDNNTNALLAEIKSALSKAGSKDIPEKWDLWKDYHYYYLVLPMKIADVQTILNMDKFKNVFEIELQESKKKDCNKSECDKEECNKNDKPEDKQKQLNEDETQNRRVVNILLRYFEFHPVTGEPNPEYDPDFSAQDALEQMIDIFW